MGQMGQKRQFQPDVIIKSPHRDNVRAPIQLTRKRESRHPKRFFCKKKLIRIPINSNRVMRPVKRNKLIFSAMKSTNHVLPQFTVSREVDPNSKPNCTFCHKSNACFHLKQKELSSAQIAISRITSRRSLIQERKSVGPRMELQVTPGLIGYSC